MAQLVIAVAYVRHGDCRQQAKLKGSGARTGQFLFLFGPKQIDYFRLAVTLG